MSKIAGLCAIEMVEDGMIVIYRKREPFFYYAPAMIMAGALSVTPVCPSVLYVRTLHPDRRPLSNSNILSEVYETWSHCLVP